MLGWGVGDLSERATLKLRLEGKAEEGLWVAVGCRVAGAAGEWQTSVRPGHLPSSPHLPHGEDDHEALQDAPAPRLQGAGTVVQLPS